MPTTFMRSAVERLLMHDRDQLSEDYSTWIGRTERRSDEITAWPLRAYAATLDRDDPPPKPGDPLPPGTHWLFFLPAGRQSELDRDGHSRRGSFLPPVALPRRMWAGGRLLFLDPLRVGDRAERFSTIKDVSQREGRSGRLCFVLVEHRISTSRGPALVEEHEIVYREAPAPGGARPTKRAAPGEAQWQRTIVPDDVLLFRYSALTFNGHRIHYDRTYVSEVEGYPGLVVHGPLQATLLLDLVRRERPGIRLREIAYRASAPLFDTAPFTLNGRLGEGNAAELWTAGPDGSAAMSARVTW